MYNIDLKENEMIIYNNDDAKIKIKGKVIEVSLVITNTRLIILQDSNKLGNMNNVLRTTKAMGFIPNREIIFEALLDDIINVISNEYSKIVLKDNTFIDISDENIIYILQKS